MNFWDTSALVALSVEEPQRQATLRVLEADDQIVVWWGTAIEYVATPAAVVEPLAGPTKRRGHWLFGRHRRHWTTA